MARPKISVALGSEIEWHPWWNLIGFGFSRFLWCDGHPLPPTITDSRHTCRIDWGKKVLRISAAFCPWTYISVNPFADNPQNSGYGKKMEQIAEGNGVNKFLLLHKLLVTISESPWYFVAEIWHWMTQNVLWEHKIYMGIIACIRT